MSKKTKGRPDSIDVHVGKRLRVRRSLAGLSQEKLAEQIGLTFQQVQKYERGINRISAERLYQFSEILGVPIEYFYQDCKQSNLEAPALSDPKDILNDKDLTRLIKAYNEVSDEQARKEILKFVTNRVNRIGKRR